MTGNEIEKALYENYDKTITEWLDCYGVYSYIRRLKQQNEDMHGELMSLRAYIDNHEEVWKSNAEAENKRFVKNMQNVLEIEKEQIRKDTAREILQQLNEWLNRETPLKDDIQELAKKYGVEVDE